MSVTKAIIPVAGWGSRRLPITKAIEKCMLPIGNRPTIDYVVRDCVQAGITDIYFVVSQGSTQLQSYYSTNEALNTYLQYNGGQDLIPLVTPPQNINFHYIEQPADGKYGTAVPVGLCVPYLQKGESVAVLMGDVFLYDHDGSSDLLKQKEATPEGTCSMLVSEVPHEEVSHYGVVQFAPETGAFERIVEKPTVDQAPSNYINSSRYILTYDIMQQVKNYTDLDVSGEYYLTELINQYVLSGGFMKVVPATGQFLDSGTLENWIHANEVVVRGAK